MLPVLQPVRGLRADGRNDMNVAAILRQKGRAVTTAGPDTTLLDVADKLAAKRIGAIVDRRRAAARCAGIVSERDIIRALAEQGPECLTRPVSRDHDPAGRDLPGDRYAR